jgi:hypothetical protein
MSVFVKGKCPLCHSGVFVAQGEWLTCSGAECPDPLFVSDIFSKYEECNKNLGEQMALVTLLKTPGVTLHGLSKLQNTHDAMEVTSAPNL